jgi:hypothetical protein
MKSYRESEDMYMNSEHYALVTLPQEKETQVPS